SYAVRTSFIKRIGGWNSSLTVWDDWELGLRILLNEPKMKGIFRVLAHIYPQEASITGTDFHSKAGEWEKAIEACEKDAETLTSDSLRDRILDMLLYRRINLAAIYDREGFPEKGEKLFKESVSQADLSKFRKRILRFIYKYTVCGGRAGYLLWK
ncbi:MAG: hypothetical protein K2N05_12230, partial [Muribaculaceae bacterium]|nr:hypothetical protein [Muribaculaceae bacterium]